MLALASACGARSGVDLDAPPRRDAGPFDAGFDTFPCRWSLTQPTIVARGGDTPFTDLAGGVHGARDEALVAARLGDAWVGARLGLADPSVILETTTIAAEGIFGHADGWVTQPPGTCTFEERGNDLAVHGLRAELPTFTRCILEDDDPQHADISALSPSAFGAVSENVRTGVPVEAIISRSGPGYVRSVRNELGFMILSIELHQLSAYRMTPEGRLIGRTDLAPQDELFDVALDRVRPAALILRRDPTGVFHIERVPFEGPRLLPLGGATAVAGTPFGTIAANETEALVPLRDGRLLVAPVDGSAVRFVGPVSERPLDAMVVVLRPGSSGGGLLYAERAADGTQLVFRALTCNR